LLHIDEVLMESPQIQPMRSHTQSAEIMAFDSLWKITKSKQDFRRPSLGQIEHRRLKVQATDDNYQPVIEHL
jgi:hypothetical protein